MAAGNRSGRKKRKKRNKEKDREREETLTQLKKSKLPTEAVFS